MASSSASPGTERVLKRANPNTIHDKFLVGYQGWFTCAGDGEPIGPGHHGWLHWFDKPIPDGGRPNLDVWPDVSAYSQSELYAAPGLTMKGGEPAMLFSSRNGKTVQRHFHWMAEHGVDGAFLQRFAEQCDMERGCEGIRRVRDEVGDRVREAAEKEGRVFAIMYDVTNVPADRIQRVLEQDWMHLVHTKRILDSPNYLKERGCPVVALWGFGFENAGHTPALVRSITHFFRTATPGGVYLMAGTPTHWRTSDGDADRHPEFVDVWLNEFDAISPWTIGRYNTEDEADHFAATKMQGDIDLIKRRNDEGRWRRIDYIPVVHPGASGYNLSQGNWKFNAAPRNGGRFLWKQIFNARRTGAKIIYGAMWDEYDEGTAFLPVVSHKRNLPVSDKWTFLALDAEGHDLPSDWYMRICGFAAEALRGERRLFDSFPSKELQDYWGTRPKYEYLPVQSTGLGSGHNIVTQGSSSGAAGSSAGGSSGAGTGDGQTYEQWLATQQTQAEEAPPPPYSLEAEELESASTPAAPATSNAQPVNQQSSAPPPTASVAPSGTPAVNHQVHPQGYAPHSANTLPPGVSSNTVTALANDFSQIGLSGTPISAPGAGRPEEAGSISASPPPLHPSHPNAQSYGPSSYGRPIARPPAQSTGPTGFQSRPPSTQPPSTVSSPSIGQHPAGNGQWGPGPAQAPYPPTGGASLTRPQTFTANSFGRPPTTASPPANSQYQPGGANLSRPQTFTANSYASPNTPHTQTTLPPNVGPTIASQYSPPTGGANLSRPQTFSANSYNATPTLRPPAGGPPRPNSAASSTASSPYGSLPPSPNLPHGSNQGVGVAPSPPSSYNPPMPGFPGAPSGASSSSYAPPVPSSSYTPPSAPNFPGSHSYPSQDAYAHSYLKNSGPSFPNSTHPGGNEGPGFPTNTFNQPQQWTPGAGGGVGGGPSPHASYPNTPAGSNNYGASSVSYPGGSQSYEPSPSMPSHLGPSNHMGSTPSAGPQFPNAAGGEMNYFGAPSSNASSYPNAPGGLNPGMPSSYQHAPPSSTPNQQMLWQPGQPPPPPPRPSNYAGTGSYASLASTSSKPSGFYLSSTSGAGSSALGLALSAVDKVAGRKTTEQLVSGVGSLAQTGTKLFNKFTK